MNSLILELWENRERTTTPTLSRAAFFLPPVRARSPKKKKAAGWRSFMAWIKSHEEIGQHPKTYALATALNVDTPTAVGVLHLLWHFTLKFAWRTGNLTKFEPSAIAQSVDWKGDVTLLITSLQKTGWMDKMVVHDWLDYAGKIVDDRLYNEKRRKTALNGDSLRKTPARVEKSRVDKTREEKKEDNTLAQAPKRAPFLKPSVEDVKAYCQSKGLRLDTQHFWDHYEANGWKVGRNPMRNWQAAIGTWMRSEFRSEDKNGTHDSQGISGIAASFQRNRELRGLPGLRKVTEASARQVLDGIRDLPVDTQALIESRSPKPIGSGVAGNGSDVA